VEQADLLYELENSMFHFGLTLDPLSTYKVP
jgi:hypothetical protein